MKTLATLLLLLGSTAFALPAQAQAERQPLRKAKAPIRIVEAAKYSSTGYDLKALEALDVHLIGSPPQLTKKEQRDAEKKLTPYAQALLNNELLREQPAKMNENGVF